MKFGEKLLQAGLIIQAQLDSALSHQQQTGQLLGEALLELGYISEETLLKLLAKEFNTRYVSTERLSRAKVQPELFELIPRKLAEERLLFPILLDKQQGKITVISCEPQNEEALLEVQIISGMKKVEFFVAQRDAIRALIKKHYRGDIQAFDMLDKEKRKELDKVMHGFTEAFSDESVQIEGDVKPRSSGPAIQETKEIQTPPQKASTWTKALEDLRSHSLVSNNDFIETLNILVGLVELTLPNRQGHSARVARAVKVISERMGLSERDTNYNIISAYLHELGKKSSPHLTLLAIAFNPEYRVIASRYHLTPCRLFDSVHLPSEVNNILSHLYENFDGTGLPEELKAQEIPLGSRIIALVDTYEDLINNPNNVFGTTFKPLLTLERIKKNQGILFDPNLIELLERQLTGKTQGDRHGSPKPMILVADPNSTSMTDLLRHLYKSGFQVKIAHDSLATEELMNAENPSAIFLELNMQPTDGLTLLRRWHELGRNTPVFMMAENPPPDSITNAFKEGVADFVTKPFLPDVIVAKLRKVIDPNRPQETIKNQKEQPLPALFEPVKPKEVSALVSIEVEPPDSSDESLPTKSPTTFAGISEAKGRILTGSLENKKALSLIQALVAKRLTGLLTLRDGEKKGEIWFEDGHIFHSTLEYLEGEEAFLELAGWQNCVYRFDPEQPPRSRAIKTATAKLLQVASFSSD